MTWTADFLTTAHALADEAREISLKWFRAPLSVDFKSDRSPVTEADRAVEALLRQRLALLYPDHGLAGEEFEPIQQQADHVWFVDPIDGTKSFVSGFPLWGTLIALVHRGQALLGMIDAPAMNERWSAMRGSTAWHQQAGQAHRCTTSDCAELSTARLCLPAPDGFQNEAAVAVKELSKRVALVRYGGDCYSYGLLASGHIDLVVESGLDDHDYLPMLAVIEAAGGVISDWSGSPLDLNSAGHVVAAATRELHRQALQALAGAQG